MKTLKVISEGEKELYAEMGKWIDAGEIDEGVYIQEEIKSFLSQQNKLLIEAVLSDVGEWAEKNHFRTDTTGETGGVVKVLYLSDLQSHLTKLKEDYSK